jgi:UDP-glucuronate decarboxylase
MILNKFESEDFEYIAINIPRNLFYGKTVLLLGGSGFLGSSFKNFFLYCNWLVREGVSRNEILPIKIISVDNYIKGTKTLNDEIEDENLTSINHDLTTPLGFKLGNIKVDYIINCAGNASPANYAKYPLETMDISTFGVRHALELAYYHKCPILNFSSSEVLGTPNEHEIPSDESVIPRIHSLNKRAPYDVTKLYIETLSWVFRNKYGVEAKVIRPFNIIGYFNKNDFRVIPNYLKKVFDDEPIEVFAPGTQTRTFCFYSDFMIGAIRVLLFGKDVVYHLGNSDNEISMIDLANKIATLANKPHLVRLVPTPEVYKHEPKRRCPSIEKARNELNYNPQVGLDDMLCRIYSWAKENY